MSSPLFQRVQESFSALLDKSQTYLVAYSGGPDSTFLIYALLTCGYKKLLPYYINYHDSDEVVLEESVVKANLDRWGLANRVIDSIDSKEKYKGKNFEEEARIDRYSLFASYIQHSSEPIKAVLTAHHQDDLIATYLMQKAKGLVTDAKGLKERVVLCGAEVIRPLLNVRKEEMLSFLKSNDIPFYDDKTNNNLKRTRNFLRKTRVEKMSDEEAEKLYLQIVQENKHIEEFEKQIDTLCNNVCSNALYNSLKDDDKKRLLYRWCEKEMKAKSEKKYVSARNLAYQNLKKVHSTCVTDLGEGLWLYRNQDDFYIKPAIELLPYAFKMDKPESVQNSLLKAAVTDLKSFNLQSSSFPITIRSANRDDVFGTGIISHSVWTFLKRQKVPNYIRNIYPVIEDRNGKIVFVPFFRDLKDGKIPLAFKDVIL